MQKITKPLLLFFLFIVIASCEQKREETKATADYLEEITVLQLQDGYTKGTFTAEQVVKDYLARIEAIYKKRLRAEHSF